MMDNLENANRLADQLDQTLPPNSNEIRENAEHNPQVDAAAWMASAPVPTLSPEAFARIEAQIMDALPTPTVMRPRFTIPMIAAAMIVALVLVGALLLAVRDQDGQPGTDIAQNRTLTITPTPTVTSTAVLPVSETPTLEITDESMGGTGGGNATATVLRPTVTMTDTTSSSATPTPVEPTEPPEVIVTTTVPTTVMNTGTATPVPPTPVETTAVVETAVTEATLVPPITPPPTTMATPSAAALILEGPIEAITENTVRIYSIDVQLEPNDPLLRVLRISDILRVEGEVVNSETGFSVSAQTVTLNNDDPILNEVYIQPGTNEVWRDSGDCTNPPPPWAAANGWRQRCQVQVQPPANNGSNGNPGNGGGNSGGSGGGNGGGDDDDDDGGGNDDDD